MPLFMDIHKVNTDAFTVQDIVTAHLKDLVVQERVQASYKHNY
jgi:hypothetical protein